jgi:hypothetical protein
MRKEKREKRMMMMIFGGIHSFIFYGNSKINFQFYSTAKSFKLLNAS